MPNASRLFDYAASRNMVWKWRTRPVGGAWEALVRLHHIGEGASPFWLGKGSTEQDALDHAIDLAVSYWQETEGTGLSASDSRHRHSSAHRQASTVVGVTAAVRSRADHVARVPRLVDAIGLPE